MCLALNALYAQNVGLSLVHPLWEWLYLFNNKNSQTSTCLCLPGTGISVPLPPGEILSFIVWFLCISLAK